MCLKKMRVLLILLITIIDFSVGSYAKDSSSKVIFDLLDTITIGVLSLAAVLVVVSTCYDIRCTYTNQPKHPVAIIFSVYSNGRRIFSSNVNKSVEIHCLHGIRVLCLFWVIDRHTRSMISGIASNPEFNYEFVRNYYNIFLLSSSHSVDSFFVLSGMLVAWKVMEQMKKNNFRALELYVNRYFRLTPTLAAVILFNVSLMKYIRNGPLWNCFFLSNSNDCKMYWWSALLYIQNYVNGANMCILPSWYLCVDMQLFIFAPLLIYLLYHYEKVAIVFIGALIIFASVWTIAVYCIYDISNQIFQTRTTSENSLYDYYATHTRMSAWLIGVLLGFSIYSYNHKRILKSKICIKMGWLLALTGFCSVLLINYAMQQNEQNFPPFYHGLCTAYNRIVWSASLSFVIFECHKGSGGLVNCVLSLSLWKPLSSLSYGIFIIHMPVAHVVMYSIREPIYLSNFVIFKYNLLILSISLIISLLASLAFEFPFHALEKLFWNDSKTTSSRSSEVPRPQIMTNV